MNFALSFDEPPLLCEQPVGGLFVCHNPATCDLVLMRVCPPEPNAVPKPDDLHTVVVLGSRGIGRRDPGYVPAGALLELDGKSPVTVLDQDGPVALSVLRRHDGT
jgi:hypothetical protein